jgi:hypothetical protein
MERYRVRCVRSGDTVGRARRSNLRSSAILFHELSPSQTNPRNFVASDSCMKYEEDERIRQLCQKVFSADSDGVFQAALQELRDEISGSMTRARERLTHLAIIESHSKAGD